MSLISKFFPAGNNCNFTSLIRNVNTEAKAFKVFQLLKILEFENPKCECEIKGLFWIKKNKSSNKCGFKWRCNYCKIRFNPLKNTWFENSHLGFLQNFELVVHWMFRISFDNTLLDLKCGSATLVNWKNLCKKVCESSINKPGKKIGGYGDFVEVDETHLFRRKHHRGHRVKGESIWVLGGVDRNTKQRFMVRVVDRKKNTLWPILAKWIKKGTILITDGHKSYNGIEKYRRLGLAAHETVIHKYNFVDKTFPEIHTNQIESSWGKMKRIVHRTGKNEDVDLSVCEYLYRHKLNLLFGKRNYGLKMLKFFKDVRRVYPGPNR